MTPGAGQSLTGSERNNRATKTARMGARAMRSPPVARCKSLALALSYRSSIPITSRRRLYATHVHDARRAGAVGRSLSRGESLEGRSAGRGVFDHRPGVRRLLRSAVAEDVQQNALRGERTAGGAGVSSAGDRFAPQKGTQCPDVRPVVHSPAVRRLQPRRHDAPMTKT